jgi:lysophospholipid acyltransferase (LPLAT)-like uncharacterized protein
MKLTHPLTRKMLGLFGSYVIRLWRGTIDWKAVYFDPTVDTVHPRQAMRYVYAGWHEYIFMPIALRGDRRMLALASNHADGEMVSWAMHYLGWAVVRGSTTRGGAAALLRLLRADDRHPNLTPDGPRGPRRRMAAGPIFLASRLGLPLACVGYGYDRPWRFRSGDRFALPRPFSRARAVFGPPLKLPPNLDRASLESYRLWFEMLLNWLTEQAETWAESKRQLEGEMPMVPGRASSAMLAGDHVPALCVPEWLVESWEELAHCPWSACVASAGSQGRAA